MSENGTSKGTFEKRDMSGSIFKNDRKEKDEHPDYTGYIVIDSKEYWLSGWKKTSAASASYISLGFKPKAPVAAGDGEEIL